MLLGLVPTAISMQIGDGPEVRQIVVSFVREHPDFVTNVKRRVGDAGFMTMAELVKQCISDWPASALAGKPRTVQTWCDLIEIADTWTDVAFVAGVANCFQVAIEIKGVNDLSELSNMGTISHAAPLALLSIGCWIGRHFVAIIVDSNHEKVSPTTVGEQQSTHTGANDPPQPPPSEYSSSSATLQSSSNLPREHLNTDIDGSGNATKDSPLTPPETLRPVAKLLIQHGNCVLVGTRRVKLQGDDFIGGQADWILPLSRWETHSETLIREVAEELPSAPPWFFKLVQHTAANLPNGLTSFSWPRRNESIVFWCIDVTHDVSPGDILQWLNPNFHEWCKDSARMQPIHTILPHHWESTNKGHYLEAARHATMSHSSQPPSFKPLALDEVIAIMKGPNPFTHLVGYEKSGGLRKALEKRGERVLSVDKLPSDIPGNHYQGDIRDILSLGFTFTAFYFFPHCFQQLRADEDCLPLKIADGRAFFGSLEVIWCICASHASMIIIEQPDTITHDFLDLSPYPNCAVVEFRTSQAGDTVNKFVRLTLVNASLLTFNHPRQMRASRPPNMHLEFKTPDTRGHARSSWATLPCTCDLIAELQPNGPMQPIPFAELVESFAVKWHEAYYPVPKGYDNATGLPPTQAARLYQLERGPGSRVAVDSVIPRSLQGRMGCSCIHLQHLNDHNIEYAHQSFFDNALSEDGTSTTFELNTTCGNPKGSDSSDSDLELSDQSQDEEDEEEEIQPPPYFCPPSHQLMDLTATLEVTAVLLYVCVLARPLVLAHLDGHTVIGVHAPAQSSRTSCLDRIQRLCTLLVSAFYVTFMVGEYIKTHTLRLFATPVDFLPPENAICRTPKQRRKWLRRGVAFAWCTVSALQGTPVADAATRSVLSCSMFVKPVSQLPDAVLDSAREPVAFKFGVTSAQSVHPRPLLDGEHSPPAWKALEKLNQAGQQVVNCLIKATNEGDTLLDGWAECVRPLDTSQIPPDLMNNLPDFSDPKLADIPFTPIQSPLQLPWVPLPPGQLSEHPDTPSCPRPSDMVLPSAHNKVTNWLQGIQSNLVCIRNQLTANLDPSICPPGPGNLAIGQQEMFVWAQNRVWDCRLLCCSIANFQHVPETHLSRTTIERYLRYYPDQTLVSYLLEGVRLDANPELQLVCIQHLGSLCKGYESVQKELRRLQSKGWYDLFEDMAWFPAYYNGQGCCSRPLEPDRFRRVTECGGPRQPLYDESGLRALSLNEASFIHHMPQHFLNDHRPEFQAWLRKIGLPADNPQSPSGHPISKLPKQRMPTLAQVMRDGAVLNAAAHATETLVYQFGNDAADYFSQLAMAECELHKMNIVFLAKEGDEIISNSRNLISSDQNQLIFVSEKRLGFGSHSAPNTAQRFSEALMDIFREEMDSVERAAFTQLSPNERTWLSRRLQLQRRRGEPCVPIRRWTSLVSSTPLPDIPPPSQIDEIPLTHVCPQLRLYSAAMYGDDISVSVVSETRFIQALRVHQQLMNSLQLIMAIPAKRSLGLWAKWLGTIVIQSLGIVVVPKDKILRASAAITATLAGQMEFQAYRSLCGLLEHLRSVNLQGRNVMHGLYRPHGPEGASREGPNGIVLCDLLMTKQLQRWLHLLTRSCGISMKRVLDRHELEPPTQLHVDVTQDACYADVAQAGVAGFLHGLYYLFVVPDKDKPYLSIPILEFLSVCFSILIFGPFLRTMCKSAAKVSNILLRTDALTSALTLSRQSMRSFLITEAYQKLIDTELWRCLQKHINVAQTFGESNILSDLISRQKWKSFTRFCAQLGIKPIRLQLTAEAHRLYNHVIACARTVTLPSTPPPTMGHSPPAEFIYIPDVQAGMLPNQPLTEDHLDVQSNLTVRQERQLRHDLNVATEKAQDMDIYADQCERLTREFQTAVRTTEELREHLYEAQQQRAFLERNIQNTPLVRGLAQEVNKWKQQAQQAQSRLNNLLGGHWLRALDLAHRNEAHTLQTINDRSDRITLLTEEVKLLRELSMALLYKLQQYDPACFGSHSDNQTEQAPAPSAESSPRSSSMALDNRMRQATQRELSAVEDLASNPLVQDLVNEMERQQLARNHVRMVGTQQNSSIYGGMRRPRITNYNQWSDAAIDGASLDQSEERLDIYARRGKFFSTPTNHNANPAHDSFVLFSDNSITVSASYASQSSMATHKQVIEADLAPLGRQYEAGAARFTENAALQRQSAPPRAINQPPNHIPLNILSAQSPTPMVEQPPTHMFPPFIYDQQFQQLGALGDGQDALLHGVRFRFFARTRRIRSGLIECRTDDGQPHAWYVWLDDNPHVRVKHDLYPNLRLDPSENLPNPQLLPQVGQWQTETSVPSGGRWEMGVCPVCIHPSDEPTCPMCGRGGPTLGPRRSLRQSARLGSGTGVYGGMLPKGVATSALEKLRAAYPPSPQHAQPQIPTSPVASSQAGQSSTSNIPNRNESSSLNATTSNATASNTSHLLAPPSTRYLNGLPILASPTKSATSALRQASIDRLGTQAQRMHQGDDDMAFHNNIDGTMSLLTAVEEVSHLGVNVNTFKKDDRAWTMFVTVCEKHGTSPHRTTEDMRNNPERISHLLAVLMMYAMAICEPRSRDRSFIKVQTALAYPLAIIRIYNRWGVPMPTFKMLKATFAGLGRHYILVHGPYSLAAQRREPMKFSMVRAIQNIPVDGSASVFPGRAWVDSDHDTFMVRRLNRVMIFTAFRIGEIVLHASGEIRFVTLESLSWNINHVLYTHITITRALLASMVSGRDRANLAPPLSKPDGLGTIHCPFPAALTFDDSDPINAAAALRDVMLFHINNPSSMSGGGTPLFCTTAHEPYTYQQMHNNLRAVLAFLYGERVAALFSWHSYRSGLATALHAAGVPDAMIMLICRWMCESSLRVYRRVGAAENETNVIMASRTNVDSVQSINVPDIDGNKRYAELFTAFVNSKSTDFSNAFATSNATNSQHSLVPGANSTDQSPPTRPGRKSKRPLSAPTATSRETSPLPAQVPPLFDLVTVTANQQVVLPALLWPAETCHELAGAGWTGTVVSTTTSTALVRFNLAVTKSNRPFAPVRVPVTSLLTLSEPNPSLPSSPSNDDTPSLTTAAAPRHISMSELIDNITLRLNSIDFSLSFKAICFPIMACGRKASATRSAEHAHDNHARPTVQSPPPSPPMLYAISPTRGHAGTTRGGKRRRNNRYGGNARDSWGNNDKYSRQLQRKDNDRKDKERANRDDRERRRQQEDENNKHLEQALNAELPQDQVCPICLDGHTQKTHLLNCPPLNMLYVPGTTHLLGHRNHGFCEQHARAAIAEGTCPICRLEVDTLLPVDASFFTLLGQNPDSALANPPPPSPPEESAVEVEVEDEPSAQPQVGDPNNHGDDHTLVLPRDLSPGYVPQRSQAARMQTVHIDDPPSSSDTSDDEQDNLNNGNAADHAWQAAQFAQPNPNPNSNNDPLTALAAAALTHPIDLPQNNPAPANHALPPPQSPDSTSSPINTLPETFPIHVQEPSTHAILISWPSGDMEINIDDFEIISMVANVYEIPEEVLTIAINNAIDDSDGTNLHKILQRDLTTSQEEELNVIKDYVEGRPAILLPENYVGGRFQRLGNPPN